MFDQFKPTKCTILATIYWNLEVIQWSDHLRYNYPKLAGFRSSVKRWNIAYPSKPPWELQPDLKTLSPPHCHRRWVWIVKFGDEKNLESPVKNYTNRSRSKLRVFPGNERTSRRCHALHFGLMAVILVGLGLWGVRFPIWVGGVNHLRQNFPQKSTEIPILRLL